MSVYADHFSGSWLKANDEQLPQKPAFWPQSHHQEISLLIHNARAESDSSLPVVPWPKKK